MSKNEFPITIQPACSLKWSWSTIALRQNRTNSCHRVTPDYLTVDTFKNFHNTPQKIKDREIMLSGNWPKGRGCEYCADIEKVGGVSDRLMMNSIPNLYPDELLENSSLTNVNPTILEVYFDNVCNMACTYCMDGLSSRIENENKKFGSFDSNGVVIENLDKNKKVDNYNLVKKEFWQWMEENSLSLKRFHFLGGEPFFQDDFDDVIDFFENNPNKNLEFNIVSNLSILPKKFKQRFDKIKELKEQGAIKRFDLTASIDCWNEAQVYARHGLNLEWFEENINYILEQDDWVRLNIHHTVSILTIVDMPDLYKKINNWRKKKDVYTYMCLVSYISPHCEYLHPNIFGYQTWKESFEDVIKLEYQAKELYDNKWDFDNEINAIKGFMKVLEVNKTNNLEKINKMEVYLNELDRRRNTNWKEIFPHLVI